MNEWKVGETLGDRVFERHKSLLPGKPEDWILVSIYLNHIYDEDHAGENNFIIHKPLGKSKKSSFCIAFKRIDYEKNNC